MANPERGEVSIAVGETTYTMVFNMGAMIAAEEKAEAIGMPLTWDEIVTKADKGSARCFRLFIWAMLHKYHATLTLDQVSDLIDQVGGAAGMQRAVAAGQRAATVDPKDAQALGPAPRPRKARAVNGTGARSSSRPVASA